MSQEAREAAIALLGFIRTAAKKILEEAPCRTGASFFAFILVLRLRMLRSVQVNVFFFFLLQDHSNQFEKMVAMTCIWVANCILSELNQGVFFF